MQTTTQPIHSTKDKEAPVTINAWPPNRQDNATIYIQPQENRKPRVSLNVTFNGEVGIAGDRATLEAIHAALTAALYPKE